MTLIELRSLQQEMRANPNRVSAEETLDTIAILLAEIAIQLWQIDEGIRHAGGVTTR